MSKETTTAIPPNLDLSNLSVSQLTLLQQEIEKQKVSAKERELSSVKSQLIAVLDAAGLTIGDLPRLFPQPIRASKSRAMYRHPTKAKTTWTGKGRKPQWITDYLATDGHSLDDLRIK